MVESQNIRPLYQLLSEILDYPRPDLPARVRECVTLLSSFNPQAAARLDGFRAFVEQTPQGQLEEVYTATFDLQMTCYPYAGYLLFGESYNRGEFMVNLKDLYNAHGFSSVGNELPDHICVMLRFMAVLQDEELSMLMVSECLIPAVRKMEQAFQDNSNPYGEVIRALSLILNDEHSAVANQ